MRRVLLESPYAGDVAANVAYAKRCVLDALRRGEAPYASHLFFPQPGILEDSLPADRDLGLRAGFAWGDAAEIVAFYVDRGVSPGMKLGYNRARDRAERVVRLGETSQDVVVRWLSPPSVDDWTLSSKELHERAVWAVAQLHEDARAAHPRGVWWEDDGERQIRLLFDDEDEKDET